ncbi:L-asparaginase/Glu-tRNA(Gln) amidotransferase subunit D [Rhodococcus sp. 27YEA15]|uniref:hypothetical protein n=1 Tax=Rhodococcus sp. 27YEA15 TaxID=3156259 RepID=UPI003C7B7ED5
MILPTPTYCHRRPRVLLAIGDDGWWLDAARAADALVIEGFGGGHILTDQASRVAEVAARIPVVLASLTGGRKHPA